MSALTIEDLKKICEKLPGDYTVEVLTSNSKIIIPGNIIEVDLSNSKLILKE